MKKRTLSINGKILSYADTGNKTGYPIMIQHGLIASIDDTGLFDRLTKENIRLISIARPGYGESSPVILDSFATYADWVSPLIEELELAHFDVLGMSSGAPYSYAVGARFPDKVGNIYIFSGMPALYDDKVLSHWPFPPIRGKSVEELEPLAKELFFSWVKEADLKNNYIRDSMMNDCFGVAQDLRLRFMEWGFLMASVTERVFMRHSKTDDSVPYESAVRTAELLPNCQLELTESGPHFSSETLDDFIQGTILKNIHVEKV
jgi:pimeloyl-ACP methyl ester carboxylesterase